FNHNPTATLGPYEFSSWIPGTSITVTANPHWWSPPVKTKTIKFEIIPNQNSILLAAQSHSVNVYWNAPIEQLSQLKAISGAHVFVAKSPTWNHIDFNMLNPLFRSAQVRIALAMALDRPAVVKHIWDGTATLMAADQPPASWGYDPQLKPYPYNPRQSLKMLESQGF
ncbi:Bacterial extracellular solute-binding protein, family 5, partial [mine drainage metagenome]